MNKQINEVLNVTFVDKGLEWNGRWKNIYKKNITIPVKNIKIPDIVLQNPEVLRKVMGFTNCAHRFTPGKYLS